MSGPARNVFERAPRADRRVVVTGLGAVSPLGLTAKETWGNLIEGASGISTITRFDPAQYDARIAGEVKNFNPDEFIEKKEQKKMDLFIQFGVAAATMALKDSGFEIQEKNAHRIGVYVGTGIGGLPGIERGHDTLKERGPSRISPFFIPSVIVNLAAGQISIKFKARGPNLALATACATGAQSIGEAANLIRRGMADVMIAGGTESAVCPMAIGGFAAMKALSTRNDQPRIASRPFDKDRDGFVLSEGAGVVILEDLEHATRRGAKIYGELTGYGLSGDGHHMTSPAPCGEGGARAMQMALQDAKMSPGHVNYINAHGTSTPAGDELEVQAVKSVFGAHSKKLIMSSTKSATGHLLGAAGALETVICLLALENQIVPPTLNLDNPSDGCDLDFAPHTAKKVSLTNVMNNSFGFGGTNSSLIFSKI